MSNLEPKQNLAPKPNNWTACSWYEGNAEHEQDVFKPNTGNVLFCSAADGWGCTLPQFADIYAGKFGFSATALSRALWGPYAFKPKEKAIVPLAKAGAKALPMFVSFVLKPLWAAYAALKPWEDGAAILGQICRSQGLKSVPEKTILAAGRPGLRAVMLAWLPLADAALGMAVKHLPSPPAAMTLRAAHLCRAAEAAAAAAPPVERRLTDTKAAVAASAADAAAPLVLFISKMVAVPAGALPLAAGERLPAEPLADEFLGFGRVFSGVAREGQRVHVLSPAFSAAAPHKHRCDPAALLFRVAGAIMWLTNADGATRGRCMLAGRQQ